MVKVQHFKEEDFPKTGGVLEKIEESIRDFAEKQGGEVPAEFSENQIVKEVLRKIADNDEIDETPGITGGDDSEKDPEFFLPKYVRESGDDGFVKIVKELVEYALLGNNNLIKVLKKAKGATPDIEDAVHDALAEAIMWKMKEKKAV